MTPQQALEALARLVDATPIGGDVHITSDDYTTLARHPNWRSYFDRQREGNTGFIGCIFARKLHVRSLC